MILISLDLGALRIPAPIRTWGIGWHSFRLGCPDDSEIVEFGTNVASPCEPSPKAIKLKRIV
ncbi:MAG TPA: hypothetical protein VEW05_16605 [Candidatus Polarisedimenticolia bacterium]|nr:hypothetical protein [Candidatus Polarisedimenticolia bacterium]